NGKYQEGFFIGDITIKYPKTSTFFEQQATDRSNIKSLDSIVDNIEGLIKSVDGDVDDENSNLKIPDFSKIDTSKVQRISYPKNHPGFVTQLREDLNSGKCRIIHYGDSQ